MFAKSVGFYIQLICTVVISSVPRRLGKATQALYFHYTPLHSFPLFPDCFLKMRPKILLLYACSARRTKLCVPLILSYKGYEKSQMA